MSKLSFSGKGAKQAEEMILDKAAMALACGSLPRNFWDQEARDINTERTII